MSKGRPKKYLTQEALEDAQKERSKKSAPIYQDKRKSNWEKGLCRCGLERKIGFTQCETCWQRAKSYNFNYRFDLRMDALAAYGGKCVCCSEATPEFLQFDHKNNDGYLHRRDNTARAGIALWLKQNNYPDTIQILCGNCHSAKSFYGFCPHQATTSGSTKFSSSER